MAEKAKLFGDLSMRERILSATDPAVHKKLGRAVKNFSEEVWINNREYILSLIHI